MNESWIKLDSSYLFHKWMRAQVNYKVSKAHSELKSKLSLEAFPNAPLFFFFYIGVCSRKNLYSILALKSVGH